jgi:hypothetical protein
MAEPNRTRVENVGKTEKTQNRTETEGERMNQEQHDEEIREQAKAEVGAGRVIPGSGTRGKPRRMAQMVSVRLDGELVGKLRVVAKERNLTLSDLLRYGAEEVVQKAHAASQPQVSFRISGTEYRDDAIPTVAGHGGYAIN